MIFKSIPWPKVRRFIIIGGLINALIAAGLWLIGRPPTISAAMVFIAIVAFLLGAKAEDDNRS